MAWLSRDDVKNIVADALREVADFSGEIDGYEISILTEQHQVVFMNAIPGKLEAKGFRVTLSLSKLQSFPTMGDLIVYIEENQAKL